MTQPTRASGQLQVYDNAEQLAAAGAELFVALAAESIQARRTFRVALAGGSTPRQMYALLATEPFRRRVDWGRVHVFWGDERFVPADDPGSNYRMTAEALLRHVPLPATNIHPVPTEISPPAAAASTYAEDIRQCFGEAHTVPRFDLIYLGLGANGHMASLFPHSPALRENSRLVLADLVDEGNQWRITLSLPALNGGRTVAFLVSGQEKANVLREVLFGPREPERLPAQLVAPSGRLLWLADCAAAALVPRDERQSA